ASSSRRSPTRGPTSSGRMLSTRIAMGTVSGLASNEGRSGLSDRSCQRAPSRTRRLTWYAKPMSASGTWWRRRRHRRLRESTQAQAGEELPDLRARRGAAHQLDVDAGAQLDVQVAPLGGAGARAGVEAAPRALRDVERRQGIALQLLHPPRVH